MSATAANRSVRTRGQRTAERLAMCAAASLVAGSLLVGLAAQLERLGLDPGLWTLALAAAVVLVNGWTAYFASEARFRLAASLWLALVWALASGVLLFGGALAVVGLAGT